MTEIDVSSAARRETAPGLAPFSLKDAPAFIERQFPVGRLSAEAYKERKAGAGQTLTALGSYWKGRKPLIMVRAVVLGCLLPATSDPATDLDIFLKLMAMDDAAFGRRFDGSAADFARLFPEHAETAASDQHRVWRQDMAPEALRARAAVWQPPLAVGLPDAEAAAREAMEQAVAAFALGARAKTPNADAQAFADLFPHAAGDLTEAVAGRWQWRRDLPKPQRQMAVGAALATLPYAARLKHVRRPEECDEVTLLGPVWPEVNRHLGTRAGSMAAIVGQLGIARFGRRPKLADTFCGGGSIPFEAARMDCDVYASDLNPIACMLTWGAFNIIGASKERHTEIAATQERTSSLVDAEITRLGIEHDTEGNRAKAYLYCLETRCPRTGWMVPMAPTWVVSKQRNVVAKLVPDPITKRYEIEIESGVSTAEMEAAEQGTVAGGRLIHPMNPERSGVDIKTIRGDYRGADGIPRNRLRLWDKRDFIPHPGDIFHERLFCIQWITKASLGKSRQETYFSAVTEGDLARERQVESIVRSSIADWQEAGLVPDMPIAPGDETTRLFRERGWTHWHHLFSARQLHLFHLFHASSDSRGALLLAKMLDWNAKLCGWRTAHNVESNTHVFANQALNTLLNWTVLGYRSVIRYADIPAPVSSVLGNHHVETVNAVNASHGSDIVVTDPPYADAVNYHEITEFFISWLRKNPPPPFDQWTWDSQRDLAIKGKGEQFRRDMVAAYSAMTRHMPDNGMQVVMFTHQDAGVWADLASILWASGLRVTAAWNIVTETESALREGNYVQGTVCLVLRKRVGAANARRMEIEAEIEEAVAAQLAHLNALDDAWHERIDAETLYTDGDLTLAAYAAALQVVTAYSSIDREPLDRDLYRKLAKGEATMLRDLVDYAAQVANSLLVPEGFPRDMWRDLLAAERFYVRMLDMEAKGSTKVADFQNFAKSFAFGGYAELMGSTTANAATLAGAADLKGRMLDGEGFATTQLRQVLFAVWKTMEGKELDPKRGVILLKAEYSADYWQRRQKLIALAAYVVLKTTRTRPDESAAAHELAEALKLDRV